MQLGTFIASVELREAFGLSHLFFELDELESNVSIFLGEVDQSSLSFSL